jgi:hypothetical protein
LTKVPAGAWAWDTVTDGQHEGQQPMTLHFARDEYARRVDATRAALAEAGLDALLCFRQESMY